MIFFSFNVESAENTSWSWNQKSDLNIKFQEEQLPSWHRTKTTKESACIIVSSFMSWVSVLSWGVSWEREFFGTQKKIDVLHFHLNRRLFLQCWSPSHTKLNPELKLRRYHQEFSSLSVLRVLLCRKQWERREGALFWSAESPSCIIHTVDHTPVSLSACADKAVRNESHRLRLCFGTQRHCGPSVCVTSGSHGLLFWTGHMKCHCTRTFLIQNSRTKISRTRKSNMCTRYAF